MSRPLYIKGSSIIETVIALTVITLCSLIATLLFANVMNQTPPVKKYELEHTLDRLIESTLSDGDLAPFKRKYENFVVEKLVTNYAENLNVKHVQFLVSSKGFSKQYGLLVFDKQHYEN